MRVGLAFVATLSMLAFAPLAQAVTITNLDQSPVQVFVCDEKCGPSHGEDWGSAFDLWFAPSETKTFSCTGECFVGAYAGDQSPTLGDMAMADEDEIFKDDERGYMRRGYASHSAQ